MKKSIFLLAFFLIAQVCYGANFAPGELIVKFKPGTVFTVKEDTISIQDTTFSPSLKSLNKKFKLKKIKHLIEKKDVSVFEKRIPNKLKNTYILKFPKETNIEEVAKEYNKDVDVIYAEPNYIYRILDTTPNDPYFSSQWGLVKVEAKKLWDYVRGNNTVIVAVVDTGVDYNHEDLVGKVILGYDYVNDDSDPMDDNEHGTHIAGIISANTNNSIGVAGSCWNCNILAVKVLDAIGEGFISDIAAGIDNAVQNGAKIINLSLGDQSYSSTIKDACDHAYDQGCFIVAAAGNSNTQAFTYPAALSNVLAVAATKSDDTRSSFSNYGIWIDVCAPGEAIRSTVLSNGYKDKGGTSMAAPFASGLAALLYSADANLTQVGVKNSITSSCDNIDGINPGFEGKLGSGRINFYRAFGTPVARFTFPAPSEIVNDTIKILGTANCEIEPYFDHYELYIGKDTNPVSYETILTSSSSTDEGILGSYNTNQKQDGIYTLKLITMNTTGISLETIVSFEIDNTAPQTNITSPLNNATVSRYVTVEGIATDKNFSYYKIKYKKDSESSYKEIKTNTLQVSQDILGIWNALGLTGKYSIQLEAFDVVNNSSSSVIEVTISPSDLSSDVSIINRAFTSPNPFSISNDQKVYFNYWLNNNASIKIYIYDLTGKLNQELFFAPGEEGGKAGNNYPTWNGMDFYGKILDNGVYLYKIVANLDGNMSLVGKGKIIIIN